MTHAEVHARLRTEIATWTHVHSLLGTTTQQRDQAFEHALKELRQSVESLRAAGAEGNVDGSAVSFVENGDTYRVHPSGNVTRELSTHEDGYALATSPVVNGLRGTAVSLETLLRAHCSAWLAPSATNWQPLRMLVKLEVELQLAGVLHDARSGAAAFVIYRRPQYVSLLGDILSLYGLNATAFEESIDSAFYLETLTLILAESKVSVQIDRLLPEHQSKARGWFEASPLASPGFDPFCVVRFSAGEQSAGTGTGAVAHLSRNRTSHRVASPTRTLDFKDVQPTAALIASAIASPCTLTWVSSSHEVVPAIGEAMFEALYGVGADRASKSGGTGGMLAAFAPEALAVRLAARGKSLDSPVDELSEFLEERLSEGGRYRREHGVLVSSKGEPLTYKMLARLTRTFAAAMGTFFLQFKNTHPVLGIVWAPNGPDGAYEAGRLAARMLLAARAKGWASIVKTGPIDLAEASIAKLFLDRGIVPASVGKTQRPALTLQFGWPLGDEKLDPQNPEAQSGLAYRERDRRPTRLHPLDVIA